MGLCLCLIVGYVMCLWAVVFVDCGVSDCFDVGILTFTDVVHHVV